MAELSRRALEDYDARLSEVAEAAGEAAARSYDAMRAMDLNASVAEVREGAISVIDAVMASYGDVACELAAQFYDGMAELSGEGARPAEMPGEDDETANAIRMGVRFAVGALVDHEGREDI
nr:hypothetical protein [uncultured Olsenella sp.]